jgi:hypothetical protein
MGIKSFTVQIKIVAKNLAKSAFKSTKEGFADALTIPTSIHDAWKALGGSLGNVVSQLPQLAGELLNLGIEAETATNRFVKFAGSQERADELLSSFNEGASGAVDSMTAMSKSTKLLSLGLVENGDEMEQVARMAINLGDQTMDAGSRIDDFGALLANQSIPRLDNFGISSGRVRQRIKELQESGQAISRDQAFKMAVMEEGAKAIERLGDTSELTSVKLDRAKAAVQDLKIDTGSAMLELAQNIDIFGLTLDTLPERIRGITDVLAVGGQALQLYGMLTQEVDGNILTLGAAWDTVQIKAAAASGAFGDATLETQRYKNALDDINPEVERYAVSLASTKDAQDAATASAAAMQLEIAIAAATAGDNSVEAFNSYQMALESTRLAEESAATAAIAERDALVESKMAAEEAAIAQLSLATSLKDVTDASVAQAAIGALKEELEEGNLTFEDFQTAVSEVQVAFGLATPESQALATNISLLTEKVADGTLKAEDLDVALAAMAEQARSGSIVAGDLSVAIAALPSSKTIDIIINTINRGAGREELERRGGLPGINIPGPGVEDFDPLDRGQLGTSFARGGVMLVGEEGPELINIPPGASVSPTSSITQNFNMTVNTRATQPTVIQDFETMRAIAG